MKKKSRNLGSNTAKNFVIHIKVESIGDFPAVEARLLCELDMTKNLMESFDRVTGTSIVEYLKI